MNVSAIIVTRGDVDLEPILESLPAEWERVVWDNGRRTCCMFGSQVPWLPLEYEDAYPASRVSDLSVYGRYAAIELASNDLIYVADDDCIVSDPQALVDKWLSLHAKTGEPPYEVWDHLVANLPASRRADFPDSTLVGWGAVFHRDAPTRAFTHFQLSQAWSRGGVCRSMDEEHRDTLVFNRTCDVVFTTLTPHVKVDVGFTHLPWAEGPGRMFTSDYAAHKAERDRMLELARKVRDAA